ncbi:MULTISPECIES: hypothetical protein [unclassified Streptomyces]|uniref:hypothetical protein n=1 Tax=unclassified Streptomyces TaxID=2593676 RepID=UPI0033FEEF1A
MADIGFGGPPRTRPGGERDWPWIVLGMVQLLAAAPMLVMMVGGGVMAGLMGLAGGGAPGQVLLLAVLLAAGPVLGLAVPLLMLLSPAVRRVNRAALFALHCCGLLSGTAIGYFGWVAPATR